LATFAYHFILGQGLEEALDAFFVSILPFGCKIIKRDVQLYFKLRLELFLNESIERLKEDASYDLLQLLNDHFPLDLSSYGPHLSEDDDNVMIVIESATIRKKVSLVKGMKRMLMFFLDQNGLEEDRIRACTTAKTTDRRAIGLH
jgi:hypothetical protein